MELNSARESETVDGGSSTRNVLGLVVGLPILLVCSCIIVIAAVSLIGTAPDPTGPDSAIGFNNDAWLETGIEPVAMDGSEAQVACLEESFTDDEFERLLRFEDQSEGMQSSKQLWHGCLGVDQFSAFMTDERSRSQLEAMFTAESVATKFGCLRSYLDDISQADYESLISAYYADDSQAIAELLEPACGTAPLIEN